MNLAPIGAWITATVTSAQAAVVLPVLALALLFAGFQFMLGNSEHGKQKAIWSFVGGFLALAANVLATGMRAGVPGA